MSRIRKTGAFPLPVTSNHTILVQFCVMNALKNPGEAPSSASLVTPAQQKVPELSVFPTELFIKFNKHDGLKNQQDDNRPVQVGHLRRKPRVMRLGTLKGQKCAA